MENVKSKFFKREDNEKIDEEDKETDDIIYELSKPSNVNKIPSGNSFGLPKSTGKSKLHTYEQIDWRKYFTNTCLVDEKIPVYWQGDSGPNIVCLHGAGHSALSFAPLAGLNNKYRTIAFDYRGHGFNTMSEGEDLSQEALIKDTIRVLEFVNERFPDECMIIVGHSMGGSIATKTVAEIFKNKDQYPSLFDLIQGLIVIDVVEGTAMDALPFMESFVKSRPKKFKSIEEGVEYFFKSGTIKNIESARISVPPLLKQNELGKDKYYEWKTNLLSSQKYWKEWFEGLTKSFLNIKIPKILLLAASDRMDKDLTIAQMQGKFKLCVFSNVGHIVHEDDPLSTFNMIDEFISKFKIPAKLCDIKLIVGKLGTNTPNTIKYEENN